MKFSFLRARPWGTALTFFAVGVLFASAMDWTPFSHAQSSMTAKQTAAATRSLGESSDAFVAIAEHVTPAVVAIQTRTDPRPAASTRNRRDIPQQFQGLPPELRQYFGDDGSRPAQRGTGSGFIITPDGYIVTNRHVVADADQITVVMNNRKSFQATLVGLDPQTDVAVIKIEGRDLPTVSLGDDERLRIGEWVLAIGNPLGLDFTVTAGIVSAKGRGNQEVPVNNGGSAITDFIQTDAAINPGNSGGPLVNIRGEIVGINTAIASGTGRYEGYGFAIPIGLARLVWQDLIDHGRVIRAQLGVSITDVTAEDADAAGLKEITGVLIQSCNPDASTSPACRAGIKEGDIVTEIDGQDVDRPSALQRVIRAKKPGDDAAVTLMRYGKQMNIKVHLNEMAREQAVASNSDRRTPIRDNNAGSKLGIEVEQVTDQFARANDLENQQRGLQVISVDQSGPAATKLAPGSDIIMNAWPSGDPIRTAADLQKALSGKRKGDIVSLKVLGNVGSSQFAPQSRIVNIRVGG
jgi:serine protease Do